jgi:signal transduction histidine kinase
MTKAVNERMKSERFKTELITNVSHDLKTPLTSIVSYVDLLKQEDIDSEKAREYIDVLDRQSQRLKKLTTDLVDASKASSGVLTVNLEQVDLGELLRQSAGEYAERFALGRLEPVLTIPETDTVVTADGRLLWRVLDNLLTNVVKYALPGTRVYMDLTAREGQTVVSVKNISREALNIPAEELMERFVRGDASRSSDGSGLGLSIARSLMELMGGELRLTLDGDLFKAELIFGAG